MQGQDERFRVVEAEVVAVRVREGVEPVHARGQPGEEQGAEEEEGDARVEPGFRVRFAQGRVAGQGAHAEEVRRRGFPLLAKGVWAHFYVDAVGVEAAGFSGAHAGVVADGVGGVEGGFDGVGCDVDFGRDGALEGVFVEGVEEAVELVPVVPDFAEGHDVNDQGEDEGDPGAMCD